MNRHCIRLPGIGPPRGRPPDGLPVIVPRTALIFALTLLALLAPALSAAQDCLTEIAVIYGSDSGIQPPAGYTKVGVDFNQDAGGDYIYVCYKKGVGAPITGLAVTIEGGAPPADATYTRINVDLNRGCGSNTDDIWLWYTKDPDCATIRGVHVQVNTSPPPAGFTRVNVDLNTGAGGASIYLSYLKL